MSYIVLNTSSGGNASWGVFFIAVKQLASYIRRKSPAESFFRRGNFCLNISGKEKALKIVARQATIKRFKSGILLSKERTD